MAKLGSRVKVFFQERVWEDAGVGPGMLLLYKALRLLILAGRGLIRNRSMVRASALAYATILALIPLLALMFAILKSLGLQRMLAAHFLERLAPGSREFAMEILHYVEGTRVTSLGVFGVVWLLGALVIVMTNVEKAFNETWRVHHTRPLSRKVSDYLSIFLLFPILMAGAISIYSTFAAHPEVRRFLSTFIPQAFFSATSGLVSLGIVWVAFTFVYMVMPNARVRFSSALVGSVAGGTLWQIGQMIFIWFQGFATYYNAIYGALYNALFLVIWMFWSWLIILFGTEVAYAHQNLGRLEREYLSPSPASEPVDEYLALAALVAISARFSRKEPPLSLEELGHIIPRGNNLRDRVTQVLKDCNLVVELVPDQPQGPPRFSPSLPLEQVTLEEILGCLRQARGAALFQALEGEAPLAAMLQHLLETPSPTEWQSLTLQELVHFLGQEPDSGRSLEDSEDS